MRLSTNIGQPRIARIVHNQITAIDNGAFTFFFQDAFNLKHIVGWNILEVQNSLFVDQHDDVFETTTQQIAAHTISGGEVSQLGHVVFVDDDELEGLHCGNRVLQDLEKVKGFLEKIGGHYRSPNVGFIPKRFLLQSRILYNQSKNLFTVSGWSLVVTASNQHLLSEYI
jgi:hypothetical protein